MSCITCKQTFPSVESLKDHSISQNHLYFLYTCGVCNDSYVSLQVLEVHMNSHVSHQQVTTPSTLDNSQQSEYADTSHQAVDVQEPLAIPTNGVTNELDTAIAEHQAFEAPLPPMDSFSINEESSVAMEVDPPSCSQVPVWKCSMCLGSFAAVEDLEQHLDTEHDIASEQGTVDVHYGHVELSQNISHPSPSVAISDTAEVKINLVKVEYICGTCGKAFNTKKKRAIHRKGEHPNFNCPHCPGTFLSQNELNHHIKKTHQFECMVCSTIFIAKANLDLHLRVSPSGCGERIDVHYGHVELSQSVSNLSPEAAISDSAEVKINIVKFEYICNTCSKAFSSKKKREAHRKEEHRDFKCSHCPGAYLSQDGLNRHIKKKHQFECIVCSTVFNFKADLDLHLRVSPSGCGERIIKPNSTKCTICSKTFVGLRGLYDHMKSAPRAHCSWKCLRCSAAFLTQELLEKHQLMKNHKSVSASPNTVHGGSSAIDSSMASAKRTFNCLICTKVFKSPSAVAQHMESGCHPGLTRHHITNAVKTLQIVSQITLREITGPLGPPPTITPYSADMRSWDGVAFKCFICSKSFGTLKKLNAHLNSPTHDQKQFACPKCKRECILISALVQHLEHGSCGLTNYEEILGFYDGLMGHFSHNLLTA